MSDIIISRAREDDIELIRSFINFNWKKNHILYRDKKFFHFQHVRNNEVNFIISKSKKKLVGILGFISCSNYKPCDVFVALWKVLPNTNRPMLGIEMLNFLQNLKGINNILSLGINDRNKSICKLLNFYVNRLNHYVLFNLKIKNFNIAKINNEVNLDFVSLTCKNNFVVKQINKENLIKFPFEKYSKNIPKKDYNFFLKRYFEHPCYNYKFYGVFDEKKIISFYVIRKQEMKKSNVLRIIDFMGEEKGIYSFTTFLKIFLSKEKFEYVDFLCYGLNKKYLISAGFKLINPKKNDIIVPDYFYPLVQKNTPIWFFAITKQKNRLMIYKGDGDQDRPS